MCLDFFPRQVFTIYQVHLDDESMTEADVGEKVVENNRLTKAYIQKTHRAVVVMVSYLLSKLCVFEMFSFFA